MHRTYTFWKTAPAVLLWCGLGFGGAALCAAQPASTSYQGELRRDGTPFDGSANVKFALVGSGGSATLWSNDGSSNGGGEPNTAVTVEVVRGLFSVCLGCTPMVPLNASEINQSTDAALRVWVDTGTGFEQLSDSPLASSPFSLQSDSASGASADFVAPNGMIEAGGGIGTVGPPTCTQSRLETNDLSKIIAIGWVPSFLPADRCVCTPGIFDSIYVGIGLCNPIRTLDVAGDAQITKALAPGANGDAARINFSVGGTSSGFNYYGLKVLGTPTGHGGEIGVQATAATNNGGTRSAGNATGTVAYAGSYNSEGQYAGVSGSATATTVYNDPGPNGSYVVGGRFSSNLAGLTILTPNNGSYYLGGLFADVTGAPNTTPTNGAIAAVIGLDNTTGNAGNIGVYGASITSYGTGVLGIGPQWEGNGVVGHSYLGSDAWGVAGFSQQGQGVVGVSGPGTQPGGGFPAETGVVGWTSSTTTGYAGDFEAFSIGNPNVYHPGHAIRIVDGTQGPQPGKVLTDLLGDGVGTWQLASGGLTLPYCDSSSNSCAVPGACPPYATNGGVLAIESQGVAPAIVGCYTGPTAGYDYSAGVVGLAASNGQSGQSGVLGIACGSNSYGVYGLDKMGTSIGVVGRGHGGVAGFSDYQNYGIGVYGQELYCHQTPNWAGYFDGDVTITCDLHVGGDFDVGGIKAFKIDHPLDPANKYLVHSCVESDQMLNIYKGRVVTDANGDATVDLPAYFQALNTDVEYHLTVIGQFAQAIVAREVENNGFAIKTDKPNVTVSWQVLGVRQDAYARAHPMQVEVEKGADERGLYVNPVEHGQPETLGIDSQRSQRARAIMAQPPAPGAK